MRDVTSLFAMEEVAVLLQYLYMDEGHYVTVANSVTKLEVRMNEDYSFHAKNLSFPQLPELEYTSSMTLSNMLLIIGQLKETPPQEFEQFPSRWEELKAETLETVGMNEMNQKRLYP